MNTDKLINHLVGEALRGFNFMRVYKFMKEDGVTWAQPGGILKTPSLYDVIKRAEYVARKAVSIFYQNAKEGKPVSVGVGNFEASFDGETLNLRYILHSADAFVCDFV